MEESGLALARVDLQEKRRENVVQHFAIARMRSAASRPAEPSSSSTNRGALWRLSTMRLTSSAIWSYSSGVVTTGAAAIIPRAPAQSSPQRIQYGWRNSSSIAVFTPMIELPQPTFSSAVVCVIVGTFTLKLVSVLLKRKGASVSKSSRDDLDALSRCLVLFEDDKEEAVLFVHAAEIFQEKVAFAGFAEQFIRIYCGEGRFSQRLVQDDGDRPYWTQAADDWKPMDNISCIDEDITHEGLEKMLGDMCSTPLPTDKPLWRVVFLQNYKPRDSDVITSAFVWKYHHTIADGFTAMRHVVSHCTPVDETKTIEELFSTSRDVSARREKVSLTSIGKLISKFSNAVLKLVSLPKDPPNPCKPNYHLEKRSRRVCSFAGLGEEFSVKEIKKLARQASVGQSKKTTVNDILITAVFRTLAKYCEENPGKGGQTPEKLTAGMWVALNSGSPFEFAPTESKWGNEKLGVCYLNAPVKTIPAEEQLGAVHRGIRELIGSPEPYVANRVLSFFGALPHCIAKPWWDMTADKVTISLSNVPGPQAALRWPVNRHEDLKEQIPRTGIIRDLLFFVPPVLDVGIMLCIISYNGRVNVGMATAGDWINQADADRMIKDFFPQAMREIKQTMSSS